MQDELGRHDPAGLDHILTPDLFLQGARLRDLPIALSPRNLVWLAAEGERDDLLGVEGAGDLLATWLLVEGAGQEIAPAAPLVWPGLEPRWTCSPFPQG